jgi:ATP-dependent RNA helicase RhlE
VRNPRNPRGPRGDGPNGGGGGGRDKGKDKGGKEKRPPTVVANARPASKSHAKARRPANSASRASRQPRRCRPCPDEFLDDDIDNFGNRVDYVPGAGQTGPWPPSRRPAPGAAPVLAHPWRPATGRSPERPAQQQRRHHRYATGQAQRPAQWRTA